MTTIDGHTRCLLITSMTASFLPSGLLLYDAIVNNDFSYVFSAANALAASIFLILAVSFSENTYPRYPSTSATIVYVFIFVALSCLLMALYCDSFHTESLALNEGTVSTWVDYLSVAMVAVSCILLLAAIGRIWYIGGLSNQ